MEAILFLMPFLLLLGGDNDQTYDISDSPDPEDPAAPNIERTGHFVLPEMFGGNAVYTINTEDGVPSENYESALKAFNIENVRFPAGQAENSGVEGEDWLDITKLTDDGTLSEALINFLDNVDSNVMLVIPTSNAPLESYGENFADWATLVLEEYGNKIDAFEIGNEYWGLMGETEYGQKADIAIRELSKGIVQAGQGDPAILIQIGATHDNSEFHADVDDRDFLLRLTDANNTIIDQLNDASKSQIDGVVGHYYWRSEPLPFENNPRELNYLDYNIEIWNGRFQQELDLYITEWGLNADNLSSNGMPALSTYVAMIENMTAMGTDGAHVWPVTHNTTNDLGGPHTDEGVLTDDQGRVIETLRGAVFQQLAEKLPGKELVQLDLDSVPDDMEIAAFEGDGELVLYLSNPTNELVELQFDLEEIQPNFSICSATRIGYDPATSDGMRYIPGQGMQPADSILVDGETYYINEHDVQATFADFEFQTAKFAISLSPYELLQLVVVSDE